MERVTVRMARSDRRTPWGFGVTEAPDGAVLIVNIIGGSLADRAGLRNGDVVDKLEDLDNLDINAVDRLLVTAHDKIELIVTRYELLKNRDFMEETQTVRHSSFSASLIVNSILKWSYLKKGRS